MEANQFWKQAAQPLILLQFCQSYNMGPCSCQVDFCTIYMLYNIFQTKVLGAICIQSTNLEMIVLKFYTFFKTKYRVAWGEMDGSNIWYCLSFHLLQTEDHSTDMENYFLVEQIKRKTLKIICCAYAAGAPFLTCFSCVDVAYLVRNTNRPLKCCVIFIHTLSVLLSDRTGSEGPILPVEI